MRVLFNSNLYCSTAPRIIASEFCAFADIFFYFSKFCFSFLFSQNVEMWKRSSPHTHTLTPIDIFLLVFFFTLFVRAPKSKFFDDFLFFRCFRFLYFLFVYSVLYIEREKSGTQFSIRKWNSWLLDWKEAVIFFCKLKFGFILALGCVLARIRLVRVWMSFCGGTRFPYPSSTPVLCPVGRLDFCKLKKWSKLV